MRIVCYSFGLVFLFSQPVFSQLKIVEDSRYFLVVGTFAIRENAKSFTSHLNKKGIPAEYFQSSENLYYVYKRSYDRNELPRAKDDLHKTQLDPQYSDAWLKKFPEKIDARDDNGRMSSQMDASILSNDLSAHDAGSKVSDNDIDSNVLLDTEIFINLFDAQTKKTVPGTVKIVNPENSQLVAKVDCNKPAFIPSDQIKSGKVSLIAEIFGYYKIQHEIDLSTPMKDSSSLSMEWKGKSVLIHFDLKKYNRGDIITLYNVYFYNDATVMLSESIHQLNELVSLLNQNPSMIIKLHGHSNGNHFGKIIAPSKNNQFFSLTDSKQLFGSAKMLSLKRAEVVRGYLIDQGIESHRLQVKAWGGRKPIYESLSVRSKKNIRVDVEILND
jgi:outer membrane protein OmpA-like peptidoglycan-associated protein